MSSLQMLIQLTPSGSPIKCRDSQSIQIQVGSADSFFGTQIIKSILESSEQPVPLCASLPGRSWGVLEKEEKDLFENSPIFVPREEKCEESKDQQYPQWTWEEFWDSRIPKNIFTVHEENAWRVGRIIWLTIWI